MWKNWSNSVGKMGNLSSAERRAYLETFAAEGGFNTNPSSGAASGITPDVLDRAIKDGALPGVKKGTKPKNILMNERARMGEKRRAGYRHLGYGQ